MASESARKPSSAALDHVHPYAPHLTAVWLTTWVTGAWYPAGARAVFGLVINLNFPILIAYYRDHDFCRDVLHQQWDRLFGDYAERPPVSLPGVVVAISITHIAFHILPAIYFYKVSEAWYLRDVLVAAALVPAWCSVCTGAFMRGRLVLWCNASALYAKRSDRFWKDAFVSAWILHACLALYTIAQGRF
jgi:hypothetical protein